MTHVDKEIIDQWLWEDQWKAFWDIAERDIHKVVDDVIEKHFPTRDPDCIVSLCGGGFIIYDGVGYLTPFEIMNEERNRQIELSKGGRVL